MGREGWKGEDGGRLRGSRADEWVDQLEGEEFGRRSGVALMGGRREGVDRSEDRAGRIPVGPGFRFPHVEVVNGRRSALNLKGEVGSFGVDNRMRAQHKMLIIHVGDDLFAMKLDGHGMPFALLEIESAFALPRGHELLLATSGVDLKIFGRDLGDRVVSPAPAGHEPEVRRSVEHEVEAEDDIVKCGLFQKDAGGFLRLMARPFQNAILNRKVRANPPAIAHRPLLKGFTENLSSG